MTEPVLTSSQIRELAPDALADVLRGLAALAHRGLIDLRAGLFHPWQLREMTVHQLVSVVTVAADKSLVPIDICASRVWRLANGYEDDEPRLLITSEGLGSLTCPQLEAVGIVLRETEPAACAFDELNTAHLEELEADHQRYQRPSP